MRCGPVPDPYRGAPSQSAEVCWKRRGPSDVGSIQRDVVQTVLVIGAGAIGGMLAAHLAFAGHAVSVVCRGAHLDAIRAQRGLRFSTPAGERLAPLEAHGSIFCVGCAWDGASPQSRHLQ